MKSQHLTNVGRQIAEGVRGFWTIALFVFLAMSLTGMAQTVKFRSSPVRVTVGLVQTDVSFITNRVNVATNPPITGPIVFDVSGLPPGAGYALTDTNGFDLPSTSGDTNLVLVIYTTNISEGVYTFHLNASGGATNTIPFVLQAAHVWNGALDASSTWNTAGNWLGGVPTSTSDVVLGERGAQTNLFASGFPLTNILITSDAIVASLRFSQSGKTNAAATNANARPLFHTILMSPNTTLALNGTNGFNFMLDQIPNPNFEAFSYRVGATIIGQAGSRIVVTNPAANFSFMVANQGQGTAVGSHAFLNLSNVNNLFVNVSRVTLADSRDYPNFRNYNDTNDFDGDPSAFYGDVYFARTNIIMANFADANNYTNEITRAHAFTILNNEVNGNGSSVNSFIYLGQSNAFFLDSVCLVGANSASGNAGGFQYNPAWTNNSASFRSFSNGRMSVFTVADGGGTNNAGDTTRANVDFSGGNGSVDILADRFYMARDRTMIASNENPAVEASMIMGRGTIDVNTAILGFQEHSNKTDWTTLYSAQAYRNYCRGDLTLTNGGVFKVNGNLTLGFTADTNPEGSAQQYNTRGTLTIYSNSVANVISNIIVDGGLNYVSPNNLNRANNLTILQGGSLIVTNGTIGYPLGALAGDPHGLPVDNFSMTAGTLTISVVAGRTNVFTKNFNNSGSIPSTVKITSVSGLTVFPTNVSLISYASATPFLTADLNGATGLPAGAQGYIINNSDNNTIDLFITTNAPKNLVWRGAINNQWDLTTKNWGLVGGGPNTNFAMGDIVTFDDSSTVTNVNIMLVVVPNQTSGTNGITVTNDLRGYVFNNNSGLGAIAGTASVSKSGNNSFEMNAAESGPITIRSGRVLGSGIMGASTVFSNAAIDGFVGTINGGLTSTGAVYLASGGTINGGITIRGGSLVNSGTINGGASVIGGAMVSNTVAGIMYITGTWQVSAGSTLANFGFIYHQTGRLNLAPTAGPFDNAYMFGTGTIIDPDGGATQNAIDGRFAINQSAIFSPGDTFGPSVGTFHAQARIDLNDTPASGSGTLRIDVDFANPQTNDTVFADRWSNLIGIIQITNINPSAGSFATGQVFQVFANNAPGVPNIPDAEGQVTKVIPYLPGPGLQWGFYDFRSYGTVLVTNTSLIWDGGQSGSWDTNTLNWKGGQQYSDNRGVMFDDSASANTTTILLTNIFAPAGFPVSSNNIVGTNFVASATNSPSMIPGIVVSNVSKDYLIGGTGKIGGMTGLYKTGTGLLTLLTTNDYLGNTIITGGGTVAITNGAGIGTGANNAYGARNAAASVILDNGTIRYIGSTNASLARATLLNGNGTIEVTANMTNNELTAQQFIGVGGLTKTGPGVLVLASTSAHQGGVTVNDGILRINGGNDRLGFGTLTLGGGAILISGLASGAPFSVTNTVNVVGAGSRVINTNTYIISGPINGSGSLLISNSSVLSFGGAITGYSGAISLGVSTGNLRFNSGTNNTCLGSAAASFDLGSGSGTLSNLNGAGLIYDLGALSGGASTILGGRVTNNTTAGTTYRIGGNGSSTAFSGKIANGNGETVNVIKVGGGTLALNGANTYTGSTTVSNGTLGGIGTILGPVSVVPGGNLAPGNSIGTLTISNSLTLGGTMTVEVSKNGGTLSNDAVVGLTNVSYGGALVVSNVGPDALVAGNAFQLFNTGGSGNFTSITPALTAPLSWSFNPATGILSVTSTAPAQPTLNFTLLGGGNIQFSWTNPGGNTFKLQSQTNSLSIGLQNLWSDYPGGGTSPVTVTVNPTNPAVFYRLSN